ncbi:hypothetical protein D3C75_850330 [compost metagenome]
MFAFNKDGVEQTLTQIKGFTLSICPVSQTMSSEGVCWDHGINIIFEPCCASIGIHLCIHPASLFLTDVVLGSQIIYIRFSAVHFCVRIELKAFKLQLYFIPMREFFQYVFQTAFADITERAHEIRPYFNIHWFKTSIMFLIETNIVTIIK